MGGEEGFLVCLIREAPTAKTDPGTPRRVEEEVDRWGGARLPATKNGTGS